MQKPFLFFKQFSLLFAFLLIAAAANAQEATTAQTPEPKKDLVFSGSKTIPAQYQGGEEAMYKFIEDSLTYPESALRDNVSGRVVLRFLVDTAGVAKSISVMQGLTPDCNYAAINVINKMPAWLPATLNGKKKTDFVTVPVVFKTKQVVYEYQEQKAETDYEQYQLEGKKWTLIEISGKELPDNLPNAPYITLTQNEKRRKILSGNASCADFTGMYSWNTKNWKLKFTVKEVTKKKCKSKKVKVIDGEFLGLLKSATEYRVSDGKLSLGKIVKDRFTPIAVFEYEIIKDKKKK